MSFALILAFAYLKRRRDGGGEDWLVLSYLGDPVPPKKARKVVRFHNPLDRYEVLRPIEERLRPAPKRRVRRLEPPPTRVDYSPARSVQLCNLALQE